MNLPALTATRQSPIVAAGWSDRNIIWFRHPRSVVSVFGLIRTETAREKAGWVFGSEFRPCEEDLAAKPAGDGVCAKLNRGNTPRWPIPFDLRSIALRRRLWRSGCEGGRRIAERAGRSDGCHQLVKEPLPQPSSSQSGLASVSPARTENPDSCQGFRASSEGPIAGHALP